MILYAAADLIWATRIKELANELGISARPARSIEMLDARLADSPVSAILVDLEKGDDALALIRHAKAAAPRLRVVAWGPHIAKSLLQAARDAAADEVLTRGAFDHHLPELLTTLAARPEPDAPHAT